MERGKTIRKGKAASRESKVSANPNDNRRGAGGQAMEKSRNCKRHIRRK